MSIKVNLDSGTASAADEDNDSIYHVSGNSDRKFGINKEHRMRGSVCTLMGEGHHVEHKKQIDDLVDPSLQNRTKPGRSVTARHIGTVPVVWTIVKQASSAKSNPQNRVYASRLPVKVTGPLFKFLAVRGKLSDKEVEPKTNSGHKHHHIRFPSRPSSNLGMSISNVLQDELQRKGKLRLGRRVEDNLKDNSRGGGEEVETEERVEVEENEKAEAVILLLFKFNIFVAFVLGSISVRL
ncbi:hypothetical protein K435DRAFT_834517 [Dendrothele bispora CBS 962.96]|uniref:Uncharacterized protein n=1 Tax=Dendrothele bispora (strain CBS 962.96) TaxID=1314807 RepID=A0A4V6T5Q2_DENBC|nr:hypothetical protein K435DRAFT_834517 [Dendrothele bispora CBS 962.96]